MRRLPIALVVAPVLLFMASCGTLNLPSAKTFDQKYAYALTTNASIRTAAATAVNAEVLAPEKAEYVLKSTDIIRATIDEARDISKTDLSTAEGKLQAGLDLIKAVTTYLNENGVDI